MREWRCNSTILDLGTRWSCVVSFTSNLPTTNNTTIAMFADDTALLATGSDPALASQRLQHHLDLLQDWFDKWTIKISQTESSQITLKTKRANCSPVTINNIHIPVLQPLHRRLAGPQSRSGQLWYIYVTFLRLKKSVFVGVTQSNLVEVYRRFGGTYCPMLRGIWPRNGGSTCLRNVRKLLQYHTE
jgi:hypothetical protein